MEDLAAGDLIYGRYPLIRTSLDEEPARGKPLWICRPWQLSRPLGCTVVPDKQHPLLARPITVAPYSKSYGRALRPYVMKWEIGITAPQEVSH